MIAYVRAALKPGARFVVLDIPPFDGVTRVLNPIVKPVYRYSANWNADGDVPGELRREFPDVVVRRFNGGTLFVAVATKPAKTSPSGRTP